MEEQKKEPQQDQQNQVEQVREKQEEALLSKDAIIERFEALVKSEDFMKHPSMVKEWKGRFHQLSKVEEATQLKAFNEKEEKDEAEMFEPQVHPLDNRWKELLNIYNDKVVSHNQARVEAEKQNLKDKEDLLEALKLLVEEEMKNVGSAFSSFYSIQDRWNEIGEVNKSKFKQLQYDYSHFRDLFYYNVGIHDQLKNYDFKKNATQKREIIQELKSLASQDNIRKMEKGIKDMQAKWDGIGPTSNEVWEGLKNDYWETVNAIYDKIRDHYKAMREAQAKVLEEKNALVLRMEEIIEKSETFSSPKEWIQSSKSVNELHKEWKAAGYAARSKEEGLWSRFKEMSDDLRKRQNLFFDELKASSNQIVAAKNKLIEKAKELKDSKEWKNTSEALIKLQKDWKNLGHVQYKLDQKLWNEFRSSCDYFFNSKKEYFDTLDERQADHFKQKQGISVKIAKSKTEEELRGLIMEWQTIDHVPKDKVTKADSSFNDSIKKAAKTLKIDEDSLTKLRFEAKISAIKSGENSEVKMKTERQFIQSQIEKVQEELIRFEENMSFFGPSKGAQKLKEIVEKRVVEGEDKIAEWKDQLKLLR